MFDEQLDDSRIAEEALRRVRNPEGFLRAFRAAYRDEQLRRRQFVEELSPDVKAEWINGEAVYHSPAREIHSVTTHGLDVILGNYSLFRRRLKVRVEKAMVELERDNFEPDLCIWSAADHSFERDLLLYPRPDLAVEVLSPRTQHRDLGKKKREYALAGTYEYWIVDTDKETLTLFANDGTSFGEGNVYGADDVIRSTWLSDLEFPLRAVWEDELRKAFVIGLTE